MRNLVTVSKAVLSICPAPAGVPAGILLQIAGYTVIAIFERQNALPSINFAF